MHPADIPIDLSVFDEIAHKLPHSWAGRESSIGIFLALYGLVRLIRPQRVVELGTCRGDATCFLTRAVMENRMGHVYGYEINSQLAGETRAKLRRACGPSAPVDIIQESVLDTEIEADFAFLDIDPKSLYEPAFRNLRMPPGSVLCAHDLTWKPEERFVMALKRVLIDEGWEVIGFPQERGLMVARLPQ